MGVKIPGWQLAIRFALEVGSLIAWGRTARHWATGPTGFILGWGIAAVLAVLWGVFAVKDDPSRSGKAPVPVPGVIRLLLELVVFLGAATMLALAGEWIAFGVFMVGVIVHHAMTLDRLRWLVRQ